MSMEKVLEIELIDENTRKVVLQVLSYYILLVWHYGSDNFWSLDAAIEQVLIVCFILLACIFYSHYKTRVVYIHTTYTPCYFQSQ